MPPGERRPRPRPVSLPFAPRTPAPVRPRVTFVNQSRNEAGWTTAIARRHPEGTGYCGKCPREECTQVDDFCLVSVKCLVSDRDAPLFSTVGRAFDGAGAGLDLRLRPRDDAAPA